MENSNEPVEVLIVHNIIAPYRVPFFNLLSKSKEIILQIYYLSRSNRDRMWEIKNDESVKSEVISGISIDLGYMVLEIKPIIFFKIINNKSKIIILGGITDPTMFISFLAGKISRKRIIIWSEGVEPPKYLLGKIIKPIIKLLLKSSDQIIVPGKKSAEYHASMGVSPSKIVIAPNSVDTININEKSNTYKKDKSNIKRNLGFDKDLYFVFVGSLTYRKGVDILLKSFKIISEKFENVGLIFVGDGPLKNELSKIQNENHIKNVNFMGWVSDEDLISIYSVCDVFILPTKEDVWGLVINEAMSCGLPIITTKQAGASYDLVIDDYNGYTIEYPTVFTVQSTMEKILHKKAEEIELMGNNSLKIITEKYIYKFMVNGFIEAINNVNNNGLVAKLQ